MSLRTRGAATRITVTGTCAAFALLASLMGLPATAAQAAQGSAGLVPTTWDCLNGDTTTFLLPAAAISPGAGSVVAPFPGILVGFNGPTSMALGTYILTGAVTTSPVPASFGQKVGVVANGTTTCTLEGAPITVTVAPAR